MNETSSPSKGNYGDLPTVLPELLVHAGAARVLVETVSRAASFHGGDYSAEAQAITGQARIEHRQRGFGFWEFALRSAVAADTETQRTLLEGALRHAQHDPALRSEISVEELRTGLLGGIWQRLPPRSMVSLCSTVRRYDGTSAYLPMFDLGLPATDPQSEAASIEALEALGLTGALFTSGRSFHFVADALAAVDEMVPLLARAQLLSPVIDYRWIAHQLIDGECRLRISTDVERDSAPHRLVRRLR
jgi:hypothetical protein